MASTPHLMITLLQQSQNLKYLAVNNGFDGFDAALTNVFVQAMADSDQTPSQANALGCMVIQCTGALTADRNLILPNIQKIYIVHNLTTGGHDILVGTFSAAKKATIPATEALLENSPVIVFGLTGARLVYCDGANNFYPVN